MRLLGVCGPAIVALAAGGCVSRSALRQCTSAQSSACPDGQTCIAGVCCASPCTTGGPCGATSCKADGECVYPTGLCAAPSCTGQTQHSAGTCAAGICAYTATGCSPYACGATACKTQCTSDADCAAGNFCNGSNCAPPAAGGATCTANNNCISGTCDGGTCTAVAYVVAGGNYSDPATNPPATSVSVTLTNPLSTSANSMMIIGIEDSGAPITVSSLTVGTTPLFANSLVLATTGSASDPMEILLYTLADPPTGSVTITATFSAADYAEMSVVIYDHVSGLGSNTAGACSYTASGTTSVSESFTTQQALDALVTLGSVRIIPNSVTWWTSASPPMALTVREEENGGYGDRAISIADLLNVTATTLYTPGFTAGSYNAACMIALELVHD
jgi:hypothetical protein